MLFYYHVFKFKIIVVFRYFISYLFFTFRLFFLINNVNHCTADLFVSIYLSNSFKAVFDLQTQFPASNDENYYYLEEITCYTVTVWFVTILYTQMKFKQ